MTYVVYADVILLWHAVINFLVFFTTCKLLYISKNMIKQIIWSLITALLTLGLYINTLGQSKILQGIIYLFFYTTILMLYIIFSLRKSITQKMLFQGICTYILAMIVVAGISNIIFTKKQSIYLIPLLIIICGILLKIFNFLKNCRNKSSHIFKITLKTTHQMLNISGFLDTGNNLYDFYNKSPVIILDYRIMNRLLKETEYKIIEKYHATGVFDYQLLSQVDDAYIYPLPYRTISSNFATMPAFKLKELYFEQENTCYRNVVAAISKNKLKNNFDYQVLLNESIKPNREEYSND